MTQTVVALYALFAGALLVCGSVGLWLLIGVRLWQGYRANRQGTQVPVNTSFDSYDVFCAQEGMVRIENHEWKPFDKDAA